jgi:segregation and condensation protein B
LARNAISIFEDIRAELRGRPYNLVAVAGGWHLRTRKQFADAIHLAMGGPRLQPLSRTENLVLTAIAYFRPITRSELSQLFGKEVSRDIIGQLRALKLHCRWPTQPAARRPLHLCHDQTVPVALWLRYAPRPPRMEQLEDAGLLSKQKLLAGALPGDLSETQDLINIEERGGGDLDVEEPTLALSSEDL